MTHNTFGRLAAGLFATLLVASVLAAPVAAGLVTPADGTSQRGAVAGAYDFGDASDPGSATNRSSDGSRLATYHNKWETNQHMKYNSSEAVAPNAGHHHRTLSKEHRYMVSNGPAAARAHIPNYSTYTADLDSCHQCEVAGQTGGDGAPTSAAIWHISRNSSTHSRYDSRQAARRSVHVPGSRHHNIELSGKGGDWPWPPAGIASDDGRQARLDQHQGTLTREHRDVASSAPSLAWTHIPARSRYHDRATSTELERVAPSADGADDSVEPVYEHVVSKSHFHETSTSGEHSWEDSGFGPAVPGDDTADGDGSRLATYHNKWETNQHMKYNSSGAVAPTPGDGAPMEVWHNPDRSYIHRTGWTYIHQTGPSLGDGIPVAPSTGDDAGRAATYHNKWETNQHMKYNSSEAVGPVPDDGGVPVAANIWQHVPTRSCIHHIETSKYLEDVYGDGSDCNSAAVLPPDGASLDDSVARRHTDLTDLGHAPRTSDHHDLDASQVAPDP